ncbi:MAG TPA: hypothetical protein VF231_01360 [Candidatus Limnocylindrales bacterium]|jgi:hypothetical protein
MTDQTPNAEVIQAAKAWLDDGPSTMPTRAFAAALDEIHHTKQRRARWPALRFPVMRSPVRVALFTVVLLGIGVTATTLLPGQQGTLEPSPSPSHEPFSSLSAAPPPLTQRFDSTLNGISMDYPAGWQTKPAIEDWTDGVISFDAPGVDIIFDPARGEGLYFALASEPSGGRPDHEWQADVKGPPCGGGHGGGVMTFDGASGWVVTCFGSPATHSAMLVTDSQGYAIVMYLGNGRLVDTYTGRWFVSVLETLDLRAEDALPSPSKSP